MNIVEVVAEAWKSKKPELLGTNLANIFSWSEEPFGKWISDKEELLAMWRKDVAGQSNIKVETNILSEAQDVTIAHWKASYEQAGIKYALDGIWMIKTDKEGKLTEFRQWWVKQ